MTLRHASTGVTIQVIGRSLAHYKVLDKIGRGGMGEVYLAEDTKLGRQVAIKMLPEELAHNADLLARFEREARVLASLNHPGIATLHGLEQSEDVRFIGGAGNASGRDSGHRCQAVLSPPVAGRSPTCTRDRRGQPGLVGL